MTRDLNKYTFSEDSIYISTINPDRQEKITIPLNHIMRMRQDNTASTLLLMASIGLVIYIAVLLHEPLEISFSKL